MVVPLQAMPWMLKPGYQKYAWGDVDFIPRFFGFAPDGGPYAEAWLGAHPRLPASVVTHEGELPLDQLLTKEAGKLLGAAVADAYGTLPFLLKVLAAQQPLSIQVHPTPSQAQAGFERENAAGVPLAAAERNYRDQNHKPELLVALTPFFALSGFRPLTDIKRRLAGAPEVERLLAPLGDESSSLRPLVESYLALSATPRASALAAWLERLERRSPADPNTDLADWVLAAHRVSEKDGAPDQGLFFFLLLQLLALKPGQGLFMAAGVPHAYLKGAGVEVMANSDNVLRCGLTSKHTDAEELMRIVRFDAPPSALLEPEASADEPAIRHYRTPVREFSLSELTLAVDAKHGDPAHGPQVLLAINQEASARVVAGDGGSALSLKEGSACFIPHGVSYSVHAQAPTRIMRVSVPHA